MAVNAGGVHDSAELLKNRERYLERFAEFIAAAPSSFHAAAALAESLASNGFDRHDEGGEWSVLTDGARGFVRRDGALIAWRAGAGVSATSPVRILGCHTDSPGFKLKPQADFRTEGWAQVGVEVYGGPLLNSWLDRDLAFAGRIVTLAGDEHLVRSGAVARIPQLAIHLDREANEGLKLQRQRNTQPIIGVGDVSLMEHFAAQAGVEVSEIVGTDIYAADTQLPERIGLNGELLASPRLDNLSSVIAGLVALEVTEPAPGTISVLAAFDHEEVGSESRTGASGPFLEEVLGRLREGLGATLSESARALSNSWCVSADAGHAAHPNYGEKHDPRVRPQPGEGPMLKLNANQRYASEAHGAALWRRSCDRAGVASQEFVSNNDVPCGSTIGPLTATRMGVRTVDVGVPLLSMHSARELAHVDDLHGIARATAAFLAGA